MLGVVNIELEDVKLVEILIELKTIKTTAMNLVGILIRVIAIKVIVID